MKRIITLLLLLGQLLSPASPSAVAEAAESSWSLYAVTAGKADAVLLKAGEAAFLIDTGYTRSMGKIRYAMETLGIDHLTGVILTHTDKDHTDGLEWLARSDIPIDQWYASAFYTGTEEDEHPAVLAAALRNQSVTWLQAGDRIPLGEAALDILAPGVQFTDKDNNNSLVMKLTTPGGSILLCGDMEYREETWLLNSGADVSCDVLMIPNHADNDVCSPRFLTAASPSVAVISTDSTEKPETPDPLLLQQLENRCETVAETQKTSGGVLVRLTGGSISTEYIPLPEPVRDLRLEKVDPETDTVTLRNTGSSTLDLSGWYLLTERKNAYYVIPEGTTLAPSRTLTIGSRSASGATDLVWDEKKLIHRKKTDSVTLYDPRGNPVDTGDNGL